jgi:hypothetical protein
MKRFQFSLAWIVWAMFVCSLLAAALRQVTSSPMVFLPLAAIPVIWALYAIFRLPRIYSHLRQNARSLAELRRRRAELAQWADDQRRNRAGSAEPADKASHPLEDGKLS